MKVASLEIEIEVEKRSKVIGFARGAGAIRHQPALEQIKTANPTQAIKPESTARQ
jgi:hypothetical protein